jgi:hypothetical protein
MGVDSLKFHLRRHSLTLYRKPKPPFLEKITVISELCAVIFVSTIYLRVDNRTSPDSCAYFFASRWIYTSSRVQKRTLVRLAPRVVIIMRKAAPNRLMTSRRNKCTSFSLEFLFHMQPTDFSRRSQSQPPLSAFEKTFATDHIM